LNSKYDILKNVGNKMVSFHTMKVNGVWKAVWLSTLFKIYFCI